MEVNYTVFVAWEEDDELCISHVKGSTHKINVIRSYLFLRILNMLFKESHTLSILD